MPSTVDVHAAEQFITRSARVLDRRRYACSFKNGSADAVVEALRPYQNPDGGFGWALEPDTRGSASQPGHVQAAVQILEEVGRCGGPMVEATVGYLASVTAESGGVPFALPSIREDPRAPWLEFAEGPPAAGLLPTAGIVGRLRAAGFEHPWVGPAERFCWQEIEALTISQIHPYAVLGCLAFLDRAPGHPRAEAQADRLGEMVREARMVLLDPSAPDTVVISPGYAPGEVHTPLDYAPTPTSLARRWFSDREIALALDALAAAQDADGGWRFNWRDWNPASGWEWRGVVTIQALSTLRAYDRLA